MEASEFPDLVRQYRITGVPKTVINDRIEILGLLSEMPFIHRVVEGLAQEANADAG